MTPKHRILLADNDPDALQTTREFLEREGYTVVEAADPHQTRALLEQGEVSLAILDIRLANDNDEKDDSGLALARFAGDSVPKIILTRYPRPENVRASLGSTVDALPPAARFVAKEEGLEVLLRAVQLVLISSREGESGPSTVTT